jgi:hypothetical protein
MPSLAPFGQAVSEEEIFLTLANQKKELDEPLVFYVDINILLPVLLYFLILMPN